MKALSVQQPWASLLLGIAPPFASPYGRPHGRKDMENRTWNTTYRGDLVIHAGQKMDRGPLAMYFAPEVQDQFPTGGALGLIRLVDVLDPAVECRSKWAEPGCFHWRMDFPRPFAVPVPMRGRLGFFEVGGAALEAQVAKSERAARSYWYGTPLDRQESLQERAAIGEYDGGLSRADANRQALGMPLEGEV